LRVLLELCLVTWLLFWLKRHHFTTFDFFGYGPLYSDERLLPLLVAWLLTALSIWWLPPSRRPTLTLVGGLVTGLMAYPLLMPAILALTWGGHALLHAARFTTLQKLTLLTALHAALGAAAWEWLELRTLALVFVSLTFFRTLRYWHELARRRYPPIPIGDFLRYQLPAASFVIHPYLVVIPPFSLIPPSRDRLEMHREGLSHVWFGLLTLMASYALIAGLRFVFPVTPTDPLRWHLWAMVDLLYILTYAAANAGFLVGLMLLQGMDVKPAFNHPWFAANLFEYWNRFIIHFKDLQVALFYFPTVLSLRRRRREIAVLAGVAVTFVFGNNLVHLMGRYLYSEDLMTRFPHAVLQNLALTGVMSAAFLWEEYKARRKTAGRPLRMPLKGLPARMIGIYFTLAVTSWIWHL